MTQEDVERLVASHEKVRAALSRNAPRKAAKILCEQLQWLVRENDTFWQRVPEIAAKVSDAGREKEVLRDVRGFIEQEGSVFSKLGIDESRYGPILADVYGALRLTGDLEHDAAIDAAFKNLRERLAKAADLICAESKGPVRRGVDWVMSWKGASILAGAGTAAANVVIAVHGEGGAVSSISIKAGIKVMERDIEGLIDLFS